MVGITYKLECQRLDSRNICSETITRNRPSPLSEHIRIRAAITGYGNSHLSYGRFCNEGKTR